jgi:hypothetical protein
MEARSQPEFILHPGNSSNLTAEISDYDTKT